MVSFFKLEAIEVSTSGIILDTLNPYKYSITRNESPLKMRRVWQQFTFGLMWISTLHTPFRLWTRKSEGYKQDAFKYKARQVILWAYRALASVTRIQSTGRGFDTKLSVAAMGSATQMVGSRPPYPGLRPPSWSVVA